MKQLDLFAGIGGISLAAEWVGIETVAFCEKEPFAQNVLRRRFPGRPVYDDVYNLSREVLEGDGITEIDIVAGGFPCQPFSHAGKRTGTADDRYLWPEMCRIVGELRPSWVFAENVDGLVSMAQSGGVLSWKTKQQYARKRKWSSKQSEKTLKKSGIDPSQLLFQLAVSVPRTGDTGFSYWATPNTMDHMSQRSDEALIRQATTSRKGRTKPANLREQVDERTMQMWPTPQTRDYRSGDNPGSLRAIRKAEQGWSRNLNDVVKMWATPSAADAVGSHEGGQGRSLRTDIWEVKKGLWGTPTASSYKGSSPYGSTRWGEEVRRGNIKGQVMEPNNNGQLNPDWVEVLMNFPIGWTDGV